MTLLVLIAHKSNRIIQFDVPKPHLFRYKLLLVGKNCGDRKTAD